MEIIIHRGTHQIGGCVTEIKTEETRIIIDIGTPLPGSKTENEGDAAEENIIAIPGVMVPADSRSDSVKPCDGVFVTHYHGDHIGNIDALLRDVSLYMGPATKKIYGV